MLKVSEVNSRYFEDNGKIVYLAGSHTWNLMQDWTRSSRIYITVDQFIQLMQDTGQSFTRLWTCMSDKMPWPDIELNLMPYIMVNGKYDLSQFNEAYFTHMRESVIKFKDAGLYISMMMFWDTTRSLGEEWDDHTYNPVNNTSSLNVAPNAVYNLDLLNSTEDGRKLLQVHEAFVSKVIATIGDMNNLIWEIGNEMLNPQAVTFSNHFIQYIQARSDIPVGFTTPIRNTDESNNTAIFNSNAEWVSPSGDAYAFNPPANDGSKVIITDTDHLNNNINKPTQYGDKEYDYRMFAWQNLCMGIQSLMMDEPLSDWDIPEIDALPEGRLYLGDVVTYANRMNLAECVPAPELCSTGYCLAGDGEYLIYQSNMDGATFELQIPDGDYDYEWFNPKTHEVVESGIKQFSAGVTIIPPINNDMVLYLIINETEESPEASNMIPSGNMSIVYVDSEEAARGHLGKNILDGNPNTMWHTEWVSIDPKHPHEIQLDLGAEYNVTGIQYQHRQDSNVNGTIKDFELYVSSDVNDWGVQVASGQLLESKQLHTLNFDDKTGRYLKLVALSEVNGKPWASLAELQVIGAVPDEEVPEETITITVDGVLQPGTYELKKV